ncbi:MAG: hypothetical protein E7571_09030 [Ruminococcaceae bacterium]|nr:hypothetical protein [Oscillospiraceae bacterium]
MKSCEHDEIKRIAFDEILEISRMKSKVYFRLIKVRGC